MEKISPEGLLQKQLDLVGLMSRTMDNFKKSVPKSSITEGAVNIRINILEKYWSEFQKNHDTIMYLQRDTFKDCEYVSKRFADTAEETYAGQRTILEDLLLECREDQRQGRSPTKQERARDDSSSGSVSLPRMHFPQFHGEYVEWPSFKDLFTSIITKHKGLSDVDRLHYLKNSLHGPAADLVKDLPTTNENYQRTWNILQQHYENKRILVRSCLDKLAALPKMQESSVQAMSEIQHGITKVANTLEGLGRPIETSEDWIVYWIVNLFDPATRDKWEEKVTPSSEPPSFTTLKDFMRNRLHQLQASPGSATTSSDHSKLYEARSDAGRSKPKGSPRAASINLAQKNQARVTCVLCSKEHFTLHCPDYKGLSPEDRMAQVDTHQLCSNCLGQHAAADCPSTRSCYSCGERHHTTLHDVFRVSSTQRKVAHLTQDCSNASGKVVLATAVINVADRFGRRHAVRALIDQGSEITMMTEGLAQRLQLQRRTSPVDIFGVGGQQLARARGRVTLNISASRADNVIRVSAVVLPKLTAYTHGCSMQSQAWKHLQGLQLADPHPARTMPIEILLGADVYPAIIKDGLRKGSASEPVGQLTIFGWIVTGMTGSASSSMHAQVHQATTGESLNSLVRRFWEQEDLPDSVTPWTAEEQECEDHYMATHSRTPEGRYQVRLPFCREGPITPGSRTGSMHSLRRMEQRFKRDGAFKALYSDFIKQYEELGHMSLAGEPPMQNLVHYLPHHGVLKPSSTTTKLRVVFNGSWSEATQLSLNDCLHVGPNLLPLLADVLLRWRRHQYVVTADVTKMYRQILMHPEDRDFQRILWRSTETQRVSEYRLNTVTYGLSCAPYLAVRTLHQLAEDEGSRYPIGALAIKHDAYVDDVLTGADSIPALKEAAAQLHQLCKAGGFPLQKWATNITDPLYIAPQETQDPMNQFIAHQGEQRDPKTWTDCTHSALGLQWAPHDDSFSFNITDITNVPSTKRGVVSKAAQLFDPLGWLTPVTVRAKITIQSTWLLGIGWDEPLPSTLAEEWADFCDELKLLEEVRVPRPLFHDTHQSQREIHGFADASERAYGAVLYLRTKGKDDRWYTTLIAAKSKVAPLQQVSLPRLELCAAHLLARLTQKTVTTLSIDNTTIHLWSDSTVALGWIQAHPSRWRTYVANRVADIQRRVPEAQWHHISGADNPADCASRGLSPSQLLEWTPWWKGPDFLQHRAQLAPSTPINQENLPEERGPIVAVTNIAKNEEADNSFLSRFSSYTRLLRVTAWCRRWLRGRCNAPTPSTTGADAHLEALALSAAEVNDAERCWLQLVQRLAYKEEVTMLLEGGGIPPKSTLLPLAPTLDSTGLLRVGGRLGKAPLSPDEAHPIILPPKSHLTHLLVVDSHRKTMHGGVQATLGAIRQQYWIPKGRSIVKGVIHRCVTCLRWRAEPARQLMGELPEHRVTPARPFHSSGVDYAGPIWLRTTPGRGHKAVKGFLAVFVCMVTKAVHLEVVSDYSSEAFLAAFRRFISRRGLCAHLYSDCGTNFLGADRELRRLFAASSKENRYLRSQMSDLRTQWHFNPPAAPHFGGLWEAAVKSTKHHLRRTIGEARLTYEEMSTLLAQVEACLNSRPLAALSDDPADLTALTPGHFLVGTALNALPEPSLHDERVNRLTRWQLLIQMRDRFWMRWQREYLQGLTTRSKWRTPHDNLQPGHLCIVVGETTPPARWPLARVKEVHPGTDGKVRAVKVVTATSEFVRPIHKLVVLPIDGDDQ